MSALLHIGPGCFALRLGPVGVTRVGAAWSVNIGARVLACGVGRMMRIG